MSGDGVCRLRGSLIFWLVCHAVFLQAFLHGLSRLRSPLLGIGALMDRLKRPFALRLGLSSISWSEASGCTVHEVLCQITPLGITVGLRQNQACQGRRKKKKSIKPLLNGLKFQNTPWNSRSLGERIQNHWNASKFPLPGLFALHSFDGCDCWLCVTTRRSIESFWWGQSKNNDPAVFNIKPNPPVLNNRMQSCCTEWG